MIDGNTTLASGAGNSAVSTASLKATALHSSVALDSLQSGYGDVTASLGTDAARGGALLSAGDMVEGANLSASGNGATGTAIGNDSTNSVGATASTITNGSNQAGAAAGQVGTAQGAVGSFALANDQTLGLRSFTDPVTPLISSSVFNETGVAGGGSITNSSVSVDDNVQRANALGNTTVNRLAIAAATLDGDAGSALSSMQFGQADVIATSDAKLITAQALSSSAASVSGNTNTALGAINDADNNLNVSAAGRTGTVLPTTLWSDGIELPATTGDHLVTNRQLATGSATANATTTLASGSDGEGLSASQRTVSDNTTSAEAAANRALNTASVDVGSGQASAGVANTQTSVAAVNASALTMPGDPIAGLGTAAMVGSSLAINGNSTTALARGNAADNEIALGGGTSPGINMSAFDGFTTAQAPAALINTQTNYGAVVATAQDASYRVPLNGSGSVDRSSLDITGNNVAASAYGNAATNNIALSGLAGQGAAISNIQTNHNAVVAQVTGASYRGVSGPLSASALSVTGNQLAATAVGNQVSSAITSPR